MQGKEVMPSREPSQEGTCSTCHRPKVMYVTAESGVLGTCPECLKPIIAAYNPEEPSRERVGVESPQDQACEEVVLERLFDKDMQTLKEWPTDKNFAIWSAGRASLEAEIEFENMAAENWRKLYESAEARNKELKALISEGKKFIGCIADLEDEDFTQEELDELRKWAAKAGELQALRDQQRGER